MPEQYQFFDDVQIALYNPQQDHSPAPKVDSQIAVIGGSVDVRGSGDASPQPQTIPATGVLWGETTYLTDGVDDGGAMEDGAVYLIAGDGPTMLHSQLRALKDREGTVGTLWSQKLYGDEVRVWKTVRFRRMIYVQDVKDRLFKAHVTCEFRAGSEMANWHAEEATTYSVDVVGDAAASLEVENPGSATVYDAVLTVTCTSGVITGFSIECADLGIDWSRTTTSLAVGESLVIDAGRRTMLKEGVTSYSQSYGDHSVKGWFPIQPGMYTLTLNLGPGNATVTLSMYSQFP